MLHLFLATSRYSNYHFIGYICNVPSFVQQLVQRSLQWIPITNQSKTSNKMTSSNTDLNSLLWNGVEEFLKDDNLWNVLAEEFNLQDHIGDPMKEYAFFDSRLIQIPPSPSALVTPPIRRLEYTPHRTERAVRYSLAYNSLNLLSFPFFVSLGGIGNGIPKSCYLIVAEISVGIISLKGSNMGWIKPRVDNGKVELELTVEKPAKNRTKADISFTLYHKCGDALARLAEFVLPVELRSHKPVKPKSIVGAFKIVED